MRTKTCSTVSKYGCGLEKPVSAFDVKGVDPETGETEHHWVCRDCLREYKREWYRNRQNKKAIEAAHNIWLSESGRWADTRDYVGEAKRELATAEELRTLTGLEMPADIDKYLPEKPKKPWYKRLWSFLTGWVK